MAIPDWTWESASAGSLVGPFQGSAALEPVSETFAALSDTNRLEILLALARADTPVAYSTLRGSVDIDDKGKFNYHVRQLRGEFLQQDDDGYALTDAGRTFVRTVLVDSDLLGDRPE